MPPPAAPAESAATIAASRPGLALSLANSRSTSGQTWFSIRSAAASGVASSCDGLDRGGEGDLDLDRAREPAAEQAVGAGDRARDDRRLRLDREPPGALARRAQLLGVAVARALGEEREHAALVEVQAGGLERVRVGVAAA